MQLEKFQIDAMFLKEVIFDMFTFQYFNRNAKFSS